MARLDDRTRLAALRATRLLDEAPSPAFDRLTRLAARLAGTPVALVSLVDDTRQFFASAVGLAEPWATRRETPLSHSFCQHVVETEQPFVINDAPMNALVCHNLAIPDLGVGAYLGVPLVTPKGDVLGALCVIDSRPRSWSDEQVATLRELAASVITEIELRQALVIATQNQARYQALARNLPATTVVLFDRELRVTVVEGDAELLRAIGVNGETIVGRTVPEIVSRENGDAIVALFEGSLAGEARGIEVKRAGRTLKLHCVPVRAATGDVEAGMVMAYDLTDLAQTRDALSERSAVLQSILESMAEGVIVLNTEGETSIMNAAAKRLLCENLGSTWSAEWPADLRVYRPDGVTLLAREDGPVWRAAHGEASDDVDMIVRADAGGEIWLNINARPVRNADGRLIAGVGVLRDMTERRASDAKLRASEVRLRRLADAAFEGISVSDRGVIIDGNEAFARMFGYDPIDLAGASGVTFVHPSERARIASFVSTGFEGTYETIGLRKDGTTFLLEVRGRTAPWGDRDVRITATRDRTERAAAEQALRLHGEILANMEEGVCLVRSADATIVYTNPKFNAMFGYALGELDNVPMRVLYPDDEVATAHEGARAITDQLNAHGGAHYETRNAHKDGTIFWCRATASTMDHPLHGRVWVVVQADVTQRKREALELVRQTALVELLRTTATEANAAATGAEAMKACVRRVCEHMGWPVGHVYLALAGTSGVVLEPSDMWYMTTPERFVAFRGATASTRFSPNQGLLGEVLATGASRWMVDVSRDRAFVRRAAAYASGLRGGFALPVFIRGEIVAVLEFYSERVEPPDLPLLAILADVGVQLGRVVERERARSTLERHATEIQALSLTDELTGLANRRGFITLASQLIKQADRTKSAALLFFADLNGMKRINDSLGHEAGDEALRATAQVLRHTFRDADVIARLGGDEFAVFAPDVTAQVEPILRERLRANVNEYNIARQSRPFRLSISLGAAVYDPRKPRQLDALLSEADALMYEQKRLRRLKSTSGEMLIPSFFEPTTTSVLPPPLSQNGLPESSNEPAPLATENDAKR